MKTISRKLLVLRLRNFRVNLPLFAQFISYVNFEFRCHSMEWLICALRLIFSKTFNRFVQITGYVYWLKSISRKPRMSVYFLVVIYHPIFIYQILRVKLCVHFRLSAQVHRHPFDMWLLLFWWNKRHSLRQIYISVMLCMKKKLYESYAHCLLIMM